MDGIAREFLFGDRVIHGQPPMEAVIGWRFGQSYSQDMRDRVLAAVEGGVPVREAAVIFKIRVGYIYKARIRGG